jgi:trimeric autotransporter adhesin
MLLLLLVSCGPDAKQEQPAPSPALNVNAPGISVTGNVGPIGDGGTDFAGTQEAGVPFKRTFTVKNERTTRPLTLGPATFVRETNCRATVEGTPRTLDPGMSTVVTVTVTPEGAGKLFCTLRIPNDDEDVLERDYDITIEGTVHAVPKPEIVVAGGSGEIKDGATDPVGAKAPGVAFTQAYSIQNVGAGVLTVGAITFPNPTRCEVTVTTFATPATLAASTGTAPLVLSVKPTGAGPFSCPVSFINNDDDENPFDFTISGTTPPGPNINVGKDLKSIAQGSTVEVGTHAAASDFQVSYDIINDGTTNLTIAGVTIPFSALTNCTVAVIKQPDATLAPVPVGLPTTFVLSIHPDGPGPFSATVQIESNDPNDNPFGFAIAGTAVAAPEIDVLTFANNSTDAVGEKPAKAAFSRSYTIKNAGLANLTIGAVTTPEGTNCAVSVTGSPAGNVVLPAGTTSVGISVTPPAPGAFSCKVVIASDDADENPYSITVSGTALADPCDLPNASKVVLGKNIYRVPMNIGCNGNLVCAAHGLTCVGVPVMSPTSAACTAFHPTTQVKSDYNGWRQSVYCDGTAGGLACNGELQCHDCPYCITTGIDCTDGASSLLTELYAECQ